MNDLEAMTAIFREELDDPSLTLSRDLSRDDLQTWDSLAHVRIIAAIEEKFGFQFTLDQIEEANSVGALMDVVAANRA